MPAQPHPLFSPTKIIVNDEVFWLSPNRTVFWEKERALILSDLHFGKTGHFRKSGIGVPQSVFKEDLQRLFAEVQHFRPDELLIVGDMFHSHANKEMDMFLKWRNDLPLLRMRLVRGNHDILAKKFYKLADIELTDDKLSIGNFCFAHDLDKVCDDGSSQFIFSGHLHPGIRMNGAARQELHFPCFYFTKEYAILPAFSRFTGMYTVRPKKGDKVFILVENKVVML